MWLSFYAVGLVLSRRWLLRYLPREGCDSNWKTRSIYTNHSILDWIWQMFCYRTKSWLLYNWWKTVWEQPTMKTSRDFLRPFIEFFTRKPMSFKGHINLQLQLKTSFEIISSYKSFKFDSIVAMSVPCLQNKNENTCWKQLIFINRLID